MDETYRDIAESIMRQSTQLQGFYGRAYARYLELDDDVKEQVLEDMYANDVHDLMGYIMYMEG